MFYWTVGFSCIFGCCMWENHCKAFPTCERWSQAISHTLGSPIGLQRSGKSSSVYSNPSFRSACVSVLIKFSKNAENADSISQSARVSVLLYPHIIGTELTMASWHSTESGQRKTADCPLLRNSRGALTALPGFYGKGMREQGRAAL